MSNLDKKYRVMVADDHALFRHGLKMLINNNPKYDVVAETSNGVELLEYLKTDSVDVILLDIAMPIMDGIEAASHIFSLYPDTAIITLSMYGEEDYYFKMVSLGVKGFLLKSSDINEVYTALDSVVSGGSYFSSELLDNLVNNLRPSAIIPAIESDEILSQREREILLEVCRGLSNQEIGDKLFISKRTVDKHRANILLKTGCKNTANLVMFAIRHRLVEI
ncbi:MAG: response regulator transcription factor [Rikenellaceae bacterium]